MCSAINAVVTILKHTKGHADDVTSTVPAYLRNADYAISNNA